MLAMLVLGLLGWRWTYGWRGTALPSSLAVVWLPLPYLLSHAGAGVCLSARHHHVGAVLSEASDDCLANTACRTGDERDFAGQVKQVHSLFRRLRRWQRGYC